MAMEGFFGRALPKLHYMREHPVTHFFRVLNSWSSIYLLNFGKIQEEGQSAGNIVLNNGSSETTREAIKLNDKFM
jgi:hypothetical protein